jgi:hypothetical protein
MLSRNMHIVVPIDTEGITFKLLGQCQMQQKRVACLVATTSGQKTSVWAQLASCT